MIYLDNNATTQVAPEVFEAMQPFLTSHYGNPSSGHSLDLDDLRKALRRDTGIVSIMLANNETGVLFPIEAIGQIIREHSDAVFHVDGVQAVGKIPINLSDGPVDLFSISGHKFHAPKGVGALYVRDGVTLPPFIIGGGQEQGRRAGTEAVPNIVALGRASQLAKE